MKTLIIPFAMVLIPAFMVVYANVIPNVRTFDCGTNGIFCNSYKENPIQIIHNLPQNDSSTDVGSYDHFE